MIKSTELRISNKLQKETGEIFTVLRLDNTNDVLVEEQRGLLTLNYNLIGIPLSEEILLKAGFEFAAIVGRRKIYNIGDINMCVEICSDGRLAVYINSETPTCFISYLHQLQNLYFALTGEELTINL